MLSAWGLRVVRDGTPHVRPLAHRPGAIGMDGLHVLLVDDEPHILSALTRQVRHHFREWVPPVEVHVESDSQRALARIHETSYAVVVSDYRVPGANGVDVLAEMHCTQPNCARIMLSGQVDREGLALAINTAQVQRLLLKPWSDAELILALEEGMAHHLNKLAQAQALSRSDFHGGEVEGVALPPA